MTCEHQDDFMARFEIGADLLVGRLPEDKQTELELLTHMQDPYTRTFEDRVELIVGGRSVGFLSRAWLHTGEGEPIWVASS